MNFKTLLTVFGGLLVLVVLMQVIRHSRGERNFKAKLFEVDTAKVTAIIIKPRSEKAEIRIARSGNVWTFTVKGKTYSTQKGVIEDMLRELAQMKPERIVSDDKSEWAKYEVTDTSSTQVKVEQKGAMVADFLVGKFLYKQYKQTTYVRLNNENTVYAIDGFLAMSFNRSVNDLRNKILVNISPSDISRLTFNYPADSSFTLSKDNKVWKINGEKADSTKVVKYLNNVSSTSAYNFVDNYVISGSPLLTVKIEGKNFNPIELRAFAADTANRYIVTSNLNPDSKFSGARDNLANSIFVGARQFKISQK